MAWPSRSPDLTACDNSLWGVLKEKISHLWLTNLQDLKTAIRDYLYSAFNMEENV
jgi:hypothetical protein